ncbi:MAG: hypothetical protein EBX99_06430, partial [Acidimicrobiia bacterium]|nr:hypothetical protein [Acidimicrobiia bacterium]
CWGLNFAGQLGLGDTANRGDAANEMGDNLPTVDLGTGRTAISISAGSNHTCSLLDDNSVKCWGDNTNGQLGLGDTNARGDGASEMGNSLGVVPLGVAATSVIASDTTTCATINGGQLKCWGANVFGQLGIGSTNSQGDGSGEIAGLAAVNLGTGRTAIGVAPGYEFTCALLDDQSLKCWGRNGIGELGIGTAEGGIIGDHAIGDTAGEMGNSLAAVNLTTSFPVASMALTQWSSCAMFVNGKVKCWGRSHYGQLGYEDLLTRGDGASEMGENLPFVNLGTGRTAVSITSGWAHVCVLLDNGSVKCWGYNSDGELGIGDAIEKGLGAGQMGDNLVAVNLGTGRTAVAISAGEYHTCAILNGGDVKCWGRNHLGQLGLGDTNNRGDGSGEMGDNLPVVNLGSGRTAVSISGGQYHTCARLDNNTLKCWGHSGDGALGYGDTATRGDGPNEMGENLPVVNVGLGRTVVMVKAGATHSCAILDNDGLKCWGDNFFGELGQGDTNSRGDGSGEMGDNLPAVNLGTGRTASFLTSKAHTCAILDNLKIKCWGFGSYGRLGYENTTTRGDGSNEMGDNLPFVALGSTTGVRTAIGRPNAPTSVQATPSSTTVTLSWTAPSDSGGSAITGYRIDRSTDGRNWITATANSGTTTTTANITSLSAATTHYFRVAGINAVGVGAGSTTKVVSTSAGTPSGLITLTPTRIINTRPTGKIGDRLGTADPMTFNVYGKGGLPSSGISAVLLNVTVVDPEVGDEGGYLTVYPCASGRPDASNLNFVTGQIIPNTVIAPVDPSGNICFYSYGKTHVLADVSGYFPS